MRGRKRVRNDHLLFIIATIFMAVHVIYGTLQTNESMIFSFSLFIFPYLVVSSIWRRLKHIYKLSIIIILIILELNHMATSTIPWLLKLGLTLETLDAVFYFPSILLLIWILILLLSRGITISKDEKNQPYQ